MIVTLTPNPSVDRTVFLDGHSCSGRSTAANAAGANPAAKASTSPSRCTPTACQSAPLSPPAVQSARSCNRCSTTAGLDTVIVPIDGDIRSNISLTQPDGTVTKINEPGPPLSGDGTRPPDQRCRRAIWAAPTGWCAPAACPPAFPHGWYGELVELGRRHGVRVAVDTSGEPLTQSLSAHPDLVKPNVHELAELTGAVPPTLGEVIEAAHEVRRRGARTVLASLGADGAVLVDADGAVWGHAPVNRVVSTVGAGDAMLAGYLSCRHGRTEALATALAVGRRRRPARRNPVLAQRIRRAVTVTDSVDRPGRYTIGPHRHRTAVPSQHRTHAHDR